MTADKALSIFLDIGRIMLENGSEVHCIEQTLKHLGRAFGAVHMDVFAITSSIVVTMKLPDGNVCTQTRRIRNPGSTNFIKLEQLNQISREFCAKSIGIEDLSGRLERIKKTPVNQVKVAAGSILASSSLAVFFGGSFLDGIAAGVLGLLIFFLKKTLSKYCSNLFVFNFLISLITGLLAETICFFVPFTLNADKIMIGDIMLLIPGLAITNAIKDIFVGDTISGIMRFAEALLWALAIAFGFMVAFILGNSL